MENTDSSLRNDDEKSLRKTQEKLSKLIKALEDEDGDVRWNAVEELGKIRDVRAAEALTKLLLDKDIDIEYRAVELLNQMGEIAVEPLIKALENKEWEIREKAADILGSIRDERAIEPLIKALDDTIKTFSCNKRIDTDLKVQDVAEARALVDICWREEAVETLIKALPHWMIEKILVKIGEPAIEPLKKALKNKDWRIRESAEIILEEIEEELYTI